MSKSPITVLLVGGSLENGELLLWLYKRGCQCRFATSFEDACRLISHAQFDLVLSEYRLPDRTAFSLYDWLVGSRTTLFLSTEVESGWLWLPMLQCGERSIGAPVLRPSDFGEALEKLLVTKVVSGPLPWTA